MYRGLSEDLSEPLILVTSQKDQATDEFPKWGQIFFKYRECENDFHDVEENHYYNERTARLEVLEIVETYRLAR